ncbi:MAG TPA: PDZ domain-containing protein [Acidimicrobiia bacterium]|nr:PDZ domain-containing protein [Acidimicrobiia bacterium]
MEEARESAVVQYLADAAVLERELEPMLAAYTKAAAEDPKAEALLERVRSMAAEHRQAVMGRLSELGATEPPAVSKMAPLPRPSGINGASQAAAVSTALHEVYSALNHVGFAYAIVHVVAHRFFDSQEEGNTADLAEEHLRRYAAAIQEINQLISDTVASEMTRAGQECLCGCPGCGLGICLCAAHGINTINQAWQETSPSLEGPGIRVRRPRSGSPAAREGLREGDRIVTADGQEIPRDRDIPLLQKAIREHGSGQPVQLEVLRGEDRNSISLVRP